MDIVFSVSFFFEARTPLEFFFFIGIFSAGSGSKKEKFGKRKNPPSPARKSIVEML
jgi:hypothetical protein